MRGGSWPQSSHRLLTIPTQHALQVTLNSPILAVCPEWWHLRVFLLLFSFSFFSSLGGQLTCLQDHKGREWVDSRTYRYLPFSQSATQTLFTSLRFFSRFSILEPRILLHTPWIAVVISLFLLKKITHTPFYQWHFPVPECINHF